jgi:hypothetical protein
LRSLDQAKVNAVTDLLEPKPKMKCLNLPSSLINTELVSGNQARNYSSGGVRELCFSGGMMIGTDPIL